MSDADAGTEFDAWLEALDARHLADLTPSEVARALRALSSCYVERRSKLTSGGALDSAGKRAAFALFYGPQHFLIVREIVRTLATEKPIEARRFTRVVDLGCGTGSAGVAVALELNATAIDGFDVNRWAVKESSWTYQHFGLYGRTTVANLRQVRIDVRPGTLILAAYSVNELDDATREELLRRLLDRNARGASVLIVEPVARRTTPWWPAWTKAFVDTGGREDEWRFRVLLPPRQRALARAAGLDVQELTARSLVVR